MSKKTPPALSSVQLDRLGHTVISLANELWVLHDRQRLLESRLGELGFDLQIDSYQPSPELRELLDSERDKFVENLLNTLASEPTSTDSNK